MMMMKPIRAWRPAAAGVLSASILSGMVIVHAWPLWYGETLLLRVAATMPRNHTGQHYVYAIYTPSTRLAVGRPDPVHVDEDGQRSPYRREPVPVKAIGPFWSELEPFAAESCRGRAAYVQFKTEDGSSHAESESISLSPAPGRINLRGRIRCSPRSDELIMEYTFDGYLRHRDREKILKEAALARRRIELELAVASSGAARVRHLLIDGKPVPEAQTAARD
jgi:hypothetical protein